jgi:hypothetical protein
LLARQCAGCHGRSDGLTGLDLTSYEVASEEARAIALLTASRLMPPWPVASSDECLPLAEPSWLTEAEIALLARWADAGAPEGSEGALPTLGPAASRPAIRPASRKPIRIDATLGLGEPYTPLSGSADPHRCLPIANPLAGAAPRYLTAFEVRPGEPRIVHHVVLFGVDSAAGVDDLAKRDAAEPGPGYACTSGGTGVPSARPLAAWTPGQPPTRFPAGTGVRIAPEQALLLQIHYHTATAGPLPDQTLIDVEWEASVSVEAIYLALADQGMKLLPGLAEATTVVEVTPAKLGATEALTLLGAYPHMHRRGRWLRIEASDPQGATQCLVDMPRWDWEWQRFYFFDTPWVLDPTSTLRLTCSFDTRGETEPLGWGNSTADEMCIAGFYAVRGVTPSLQGAQP